MKNFTKIFFAVVVSLFAFSCVQDTTEDLGVNIEGQGGVYELAVSLEQSRTQLGEKVEGLYPLYWSEGDAIAVNGNVSAPLAAENAGTSNATFSFYAVLERPYCIVYPGSAVVAVEEGEATAPVTVYPVTFAATQPYTVGSFAPQSAPMYGYAAALAEGEEESAIQLNHLTGVLNLAVRGNGEKITSIRVQSEKGAIAGPHTVDCTNGTLTALEGASKVVTLTCGEGLVLGTEATPFFVAVPAGKYGTFMITIFTENHGKMTVKFNSDLKPISAGTVREFGTVYYEANLADENGEEFIIDSKEALIEFARIAGGFYPRTSAKVTAEIDMTGYDWKPVKYFGEYTFDGGNFAIKGLNAPLFDITPATIKNVKLTDVAIEETEAAFSGSIARVLTGSLLNCSAAGTLHANNTTLTLASATSNYNDTAHGGLVGFANGATIYNCTSDVAVTITSFAAGKYKASAGGAVGAVSGAAKLNGVTNNGDVTYVGPDYGGNIYLSGVVGKCSAGTTLAEFSNITNNGKVSSAKGSDVNADFLLSGIIGDVVMADASIVCDKLVNNGAITHNGLANGMRIAGIAAYSTTGSFTNCKNTGALSTAVGSGHTSMYVGGLFSATVTTKTFTNNINEGNISLADGVTVSGYVRLTGVATGISMPGSEVADIPTVSGCKNYGSITVGSVKNASTGNGGRLYVGGMFDTIYAGNFSNCTNEATGTITVNTNTWASGYLIGGFAAYMSSHDGVRTIKVTDCENKGNMTIGQIEGAGAAYAEIGGISGEAYVGSGDFAIEYLRVKNSGNITIKGSYTTDNYPYIGGFFGVNNYTEIYCDYCENAGNINYEATAPNASVGGFYGYDTNNTRFEMDYCVNSGNITYSGIAGKYVHFGGFCGFRNVSTPTVITNSTNTGKMTLTGEQTATQSKSVAYNVGGFIGRNSGSNCSISNSTNGELNDTTGKGTITAGALPASVCLAGFIGYTTTALTISGCTNYGPVDQTGKAGLNNTYRAHIAGIIGTSADAINITVNNCENYGPISYSASASTGRVDVAGIVATTIGNATAVISGCKNGGVISFKATSAGGEISIGGIVGTTQGTTTVSDCVNLASGEIYSSGKATTNYEVGGIAGSTATDGSSLYNCTNYGHVNQAKASGGTTQVGGVVGYAYRCTDIIGCNNFGKITFSGTATSKNGNVGGVIGYVRFQYTDKVVTIKDCGNYADLEFAGTAGDYYAGGVIGYCRSIEKGAAHLENLRNVANITFKSEGKTSSYLGGICGTFGSDAAGHVLQGGVFYGDLKGIGMEGKIAMAIGTPAGRLEGGRRVLNTQFGGNVIFATETGEDANGDVETYDVKIPITEENWINYMYRQPITQEIALGDGCSVITTKPSVPTK